MRNHIVLLTLVVGFLTASCSDDSPGTEEQADNFDRGKMLINWADNIIIPSFQSFATETQELSDAAVAFTDAPSEAALQELRAAFREAYLGYQTVAPFRIGKAETLSYHGFLNIYPADTVGIRNKIATGDYNLELPASRDEQGLPALDYLINGLADTDAAILASYTSGANAAGYKQYLVDVAARVDQLTDTVLADWTNGFRDVFVANTSSSSTGSVDKFANDFIMYYEMDLRSGKIGIPAGALSGEPLPGAVEALYAEGLSRKLYLRAIETVQQFFNGKHFDSEAVGPSFRQYLDYLLELRGGENLAAEINQNFDAALTQAQQLDADLEEQVKENNTLMLAARDLLQKNVILMKTDMLQAMDISVDYVDTDGD